MDVQECSELCCNAAVVMCDTIQTCAALDVQECSELCCTAAVVMCDTIQICAAHLCTGR